MTSYIDLFAEMLGEENLNFHFDKEHCVIYFTMSDGEFRLQVRVRHEQGTKFFQVGIIYPSYVLPCNRNKAIIEISRANSQIAAGGFEFNVKTGSIYFRNSVDVTGLTPSKEFFKDMYVISLRTSIQFKNTFLPLTGYASTKTKMEEEDGEEDDEEFVE
mgnify:CR=1 FL=1